MDDGEFSVLRCPRHGRLPADADGCDFCGPEDRDEDREPVQPGTLGWANRETARIIAARRNSFKR